MKWTDIREIAIALSEQHPDVGSRAIVFTELMRGVLELPGFDDDPKHSGEKVLEAIQMAWMEEGDFDD